MKMNYQFEIEVTVDSWLFGMEQEPGKLLESLKQMISATDISKQSGLTVKQVEISHVIPSRLKASNGTP